jgi:predicted nucleotidyltransferase
MVAKADERLERFRSEFLPKLVATLHPTVVVAFGSRVRGEGLAHSDLDLVIVSEPFRNVRWLDGRLS